MIPLQDQEALREYFREVLTGPVKIEFFSRRTLSIVVPGREECRYCPQVQQLLTELRGLSARISLRSYELSDAPEPAARSGVVRAPSTVLRGQLNRPLLFEGFFSGTLFPAMIEVVRDVSRGATDLDTRSKRRLQRIRDAISVRLFVSPACPYSPEMVQTLYRFSLENPRIKATVTEVEEFPQLAAMHQIRAVPYLRIGDRLSIEGLLEAEAFLDQIVNVAEGHTLSFGETALGAGSRPTTPLSMAPEHVPEFQTTRGGLIIPGR